MDNSETEQPMHPGAAPAHGAARWQTVVGMGVVRVAVGMGWGARQIVGEAGYGGVGPRFVPWLCAVVLGLCGLWLVWEARTGGYRHMGVPSGSARADVGPFVWVSAGLLLNALLIERIGFVLGCTLCFTLAVQGLRRAQRQPGGAGLNARVLLGDMALGAAIAAPVYWAFTQFLAIGLPGLTETGWL